MARMIPSTIYPECASMGEREIFHRLKNDPETHDWIVLHSLDVAKHKTQVSGEIDFVIIIPSKGVLCLEVKGCSRLRRDDGGWYYGATQTSDPRGPFKQASAAMHSLRSWLAEHRPDLSRVVIWSAVIFPYLEFSLDAEEWHPWQVIDNQAFRARPLGKLLGAVLDKARSHLLSCASASWFHAESGEPYLEQCEAIAAALRPQFEFFESHKSQMLKREAELKHYTEEQYMALDSMDANPRVTFVGPAGTGKTLLALEAARRSSSAGCRTLLLCFNRMLSKWLEEQASELPYRVDVRTIHAHMLGITELDVRPDSNFWEETLPIAAVDKLLEQEDERYIYDTLVIDEGQDILREYYLDFLDLCLRGGLAAGQWNLFGDFEKQAIYGAKDLPLERFLEERVGNSPIYSLRVNCRNTPRIASYAYLLGGLDPNYSKVLRPDDKVEPRLIYYEDDNEQRNCLVSTLENLYSEGFSGKDIVILSPKADYPCASRIKAEPWKDRVRPRRTVTGSHVGYYSIHAFKGLEASVVIVTDIEHVGDEHARSLFYIAITRALHRLVIIMRESAKPAVIEAVEAAARRKGTGG